jgi:hypothetical protein
LPNTAVHGWQTVEEAHREPVLGRATFLGSVADLKVKRRRARRADVARDA